MSEILMILRMRSLAEYVSENLGWEVTEYELIAAMAGAWFDRQIRESRTIPQIGMQLVRKLKHAERREA